MADIPPRQHDNLKKPQPVPPEVENWRYVIRLSESDTPCVSMSDSVRIGFLSEQNALAVLQ